MADPITRIIVRRGTEAERTGAVFLQSEPAYSTDAKRLYMGDGVTAGGNAVGTRFLGFIEFAPVLSNVTNALAPAYGDIVYDTSSSLLYALTGTDYTQTASYRSLATAIYPDGITLDRIAGNTIGVKTNALDASYLTTVAVGQGLARTSGNTVLQIDTPSAELSFTNNALQITNAGVTNTKLSNMAANTVKARLDTIGTPQDVPISQLLSPYINSVATVPTGALLDFAGSTAPDGFLICNGAAVSRDTYATLFATIGTTYGVGDTTTTFNLPDFRGRASVGAGLGSGLTNRALGTQIGEESHLLTEGELPSHNHTGGAFWPVPKAQASAEQNQTAGPEDYTRFANTGSTGGNQPHNNIQPSLVVNKIIKT
jgi:microcystin-dependent protein